jgi:phosphoribosylanthranilate isomerase
VTTLVKVCGLRSLDEARAARDAGAGLLGFIFWPGSKRYVGPEAAATIIAGLRRESNGNDQFSGSYWAAVGVFVNPTVEEVERVAQLCSLDYIQLSGEESPATVSAMPRPTVKALHVRGGAERTAARAVADNTYGADLYLLDTHVDGQYGGTGLTFDWAALRTVGPGCLIAGGLRPDNVTAALATLAPLGVDVSSGVEFPSSTGRGKDPRLIRAFVEAVRTYDDRAR